MVATSLGLRSTLRVKERGLHREWQRAPHNFTVHDGDRIGDGNDHSLQRKPLFSFFRLLNIHNLHHKAVCARGKWFNFCIDGNSLNDVDADDGNGKLNVKSNDAAPFRFGAFDANGRHKEENSLCSKEGQGPLDFDQLVSASSSHIRQLDMALDALFHLHRPQPTQTYAQLLQACNKFKSLFQAKQVHAHITTHKTPLTSFLGDYLVMTLAKCGAVDDAYGLYVALPCRTIFSCTAIISAYVECGKPYEALKVYQSMQDEGMEPDNYTFVSLFKACGKIQDLELGKQLHIYACKKGFTSVPHVNNILINMYGKCGSINEAGKLFSGNSKSNIVAWSTMLSVYIEQGLPQKVLQLYTQMLKEGLIPDQFAIVSALQACGNIAENKQGFMMASDSPSLTSYVEIVLTLHAEALRTGCARDVFVGTALLTAYSKCGTIAEAENMFSMLTERNLVTWNAMLSAYMDQGQDKKALLLFMELLKGATKPEQLTFVLAFQACGNAAEKDSIVLADGNLSKEIYLEILQALHADLCAVQESMNTVVATALLSSYAKCRAVVEAENLFAALSHRDVVSWNAMLTVYVEQGQGEKALCLYARMQEELVTLDDATMINALLACSETGSLDACKHIHYNIVCANYDLNLQVIATLIHTYGNCAKMSDARASFDETPEPDSTSWNACIAGYAGGGGSYQTAFSMFENANLAGMKMCEIAFTSVLLACTHTGLIAVGLEYFESMRIDFGVIPDLQHYSILVDLLARAGDFKRVESMLGRGDVQGILNTWLFLLGACYTHGNIALAERVFNHASSLQPKEAAAYVLMSNIYANTEPQS